MACTITDYMRTGSNVPLVGKTVTTMPSSPPILTSVGGVWGELIPPYPNGTTDINGQYSFPLPWPSESYPPLLLWTIILPNQAKFQGAVPEGVAGPLSINQLVTTYNWVQLSPGSASF